MTKKEQLAFDRLQGQLDAEKKRSELAFEGYRNALYELVDLRMKIERIERVLRSEE